jgi:hypothetical protein
MLIRTHPRHRLEVKQVLLTLGRSSMTGVVRDQDACDFQHF